MKIPQHVAIILDGNGRWAAARNKPRAYGHKAGAENVEVICRAADKLGIKYLTMYAFSTENWNRPKDEVAALMKLLESYMKNCVSLAKKNNMRVRVIGDISVLSESIQKKIIHLEEVSKDFTGLNLNIAINYGSRDEIVRAVKGLITDLESGKLKFDDINENIIDSRLDTADIPDPDLLIRTGGEQRLSNYLLWQLAYSEFYFTDVYWPEFDEAELKKAIDEFSSRNRRYGGV